MRLSDLLDSQVASRSDRVCRKSINTQSTVLITTNSYGQSSQSTQADCGKRFYFYFSPGTGAARKTAASATGVPQAPSPHPEDNLAQPLQNLTF